jgi:cytochrome c551/c552
MWAVLHALLPALALVADASASEQVSPAALAEQRGCFRCHSPYPPRLGPDFADVADRYRDDPEATSRLIDWLETGGRGHWGDEYEMSAQSHLRPSEAEALVRWILAR